MKMKRIFALATLLATLLSNMAGTAAQEVELPWNMAVRAGAVGSLYENAWSYVNPGRRPLGLLTYSVSATAGYDFTPNFGVRMSVAYGRNAGACNSQETGGGFFPYRFESVDGYLDAVANIRRGKSPFIPKFYGGIGLAHTSNYRKGTARVKAKGEDGSTVWKEVASWSHRQWPGDEPEDHPKMTTNNLSLGVHIGFLGEYLISNEVGVVFDLCLEAYPDKYDGLQPTRGDQSLVATGYRGMPFDLKGIFSIGLAYHF